MATATGKLPYEIDQMTFGDLELLNDYWSDHPPTHVLVAAFLGVKTKSKNNLPEVQLPEGLSLAFTEAGQRPTTEKAGSRLPKPIFDFASLVARGNPLKDNTVARH